MEAFIIYITVFILAIFVGFEVITKVPPTLHTPLMSGANAISGITVVGAIVAAGSKDSCNSRFLRTRGHNAISGITVVGAIVAAGSKESTIAAILGCLAVIMATINVVGGFLVTNRMLLMFKKKK